MNKNSLSAAVTGTTNRPLPRYFDDKGMVDLSGPTSVLNCANGSQEEGQEEVNEIVEKQPQEIAGETSRTEA